MIVQSEFVRSSNAETDLAAEAAARIVRLIDEPGEVLLVGESTALAEALQEQGWRIGRQGGGPITATADGTNVGEGDWLADLRADRFDTAVVAGLLEFAQDPVEVLRTLRAILASHGCLAAVIPNIAHGNLRLAVLSGRFPYEDWQQSQRLPIRFYTREGIESLFASAGFKIADLERRTEGIAFRQAGGNSSIIPASLLDSLANDPDALTSHFIVLARPTDHPPEAEPAANDHQQCWPEMAAIRQLVEQQTGHLDALVARIERLEADQRAGFITGASPTVPAVDSSTLAGLTAVQSALTHLHTGQLPWWRDGEDRDSLEQMRYQRTVHRIRGLVRAIVPPDAIVLVVSRGDDALLTLEGRRGWHFPMTPEGKYAGHYPVHSAEAIDHLEALRARGAQFLLIPSTGLWWLDYYDDLARHLDQHYRTALRREDSCVIFNLDERKQGAEEC